MPVQLAYEQLGAWILDSGCRYERRFYTTDDGISFRQEYILRDNLGNTRVVFEDANGDGSIVETEITQTKHYYPFGMEMESPLQNQTAGYKRLFHDKEKINDFDLGWYDYGARWYDPSLARWSAVDPLAESMASWSPYNFVFNNPIRFTDPTGMSPEDDGENVTKEVVITAQALGDGLLSNKPIQLLKTGNINVKHTINARLPNKSDKDNSDDDAGELEIVFEQKIDMSYTNSRSTEKERKSKSIVGYVYSENKTQGNHTFKVYSMQVFEIKRNSNSTENTFYNVRVDNNDIHTKLNKSLETYKKLQTQEK